MSNRNRRKNRPRRNRRATMDKTGPGQRVRAGGRREDQIEGIKQEIRDIRSSLDQKSERERGRKEQRLLEAADLLEEARTVLEDV